MHLNFGATCSKLSIPILEYCTCICNTRTSVRHKDPKRVQERFRGLYSTWQVFRHPGNEKTPYITYCDILFRLLMYS